MAPQLCQNHPLRAGAQIAVEKVIVVRSEEWILGELCLPELTRTGGPARSRSTQDCIEMEGYLGCAVLSARRCFGTLVPGSYAQSIPVRKRRPFLGGSREPRGQPSAITNLQNIHNLHPAWTLFGFVLSGRGTKGATRIFG
jgi:hypothetical protein